jgi:hypothetical protein
MPPKSHPVWEWVVTTARNKKLMFLPKNPEKKNLSKKNKTNPPKTKSLYLLERTSNPEKLPWKKNLKKSSKLSCMLRRRESTNR